MKKFIRFLAASPLLWLSFLSLSCEKAVPVDGAPLPFSLEEVAELFSRLPLEKEHLDEVYSAVCSSRGNGYDEEYTLNDLITSPGSGVGDASTDTRASSGSWPRPIRDLLAEYLRNSYPTRAGDGDVRSPEEFIEAMKSSDVQIYWPFSENWDGASYPVITFNPGSDILTNTGYCMSPDGYVTEVNVNERTAMEGNVWVINRNEDSEYKTLEMLRREDPEWGIGGGITIRPHDASTRATEAVSDSKALILKTYEAKRNYDTWFAGASEFFVRAGSVEDFTASTEAEMRLYTPTVTDFVIVVRRDQVGVKIPFNAVLVSEWTDQLQSLALMIIEDDGGTLTSWKCSAMVKVQSKSYGLDIEIPFNSHDDIVWRGQLARSYLDKNNDVEGHFGDVNLVFGME